MSKICIIAFNGNKDCERIVREEVYKAGLSVFYYDFLNEPIESSIQGLTKASIADNNSFDNCELFLLPDDCYYNDRKNDIPFCERMKLLQNIVKSISFYSKRIEVFLGMSGNEIQDYCHYICQVCDVAKILVENYYKEELCAEGDIHISIDLS